MKTLIKFAASAIVAFGILFFPACGPGNPGDEDGGSCADKADCPNPDGGTVTYKVTATAPEGVVPQHYKINGVWVENCLRLGPHGCQVYLDPNQGHCADTATCEVLLTAAASFTLAPEHNKFVFENKTVSAGDAATVVNTDWNGPGECGVQVGSGGVKVEYEDLEHSSNVRWMYTAVGESGHVELLGTRWDDDMSLVLTGYSFTGVGATGVCTGCSVDGTVSQDLSTITYHWVQPGAGEGDTTFNRRR